MNTLLSPVNRSSVHSGPALFFGRLVFAGFHIDTAIGFYTTAIFTTSFLISHK